MIIKTKIQHNTDDYTNYVYAMNRIIRTIKEHYSEAEQNSKNPYELFTDAYEKYSFNEVFEHADEEIVIKELIEQIVNNEWKPEDDEEIKEYLENRRNLVLPILEEGTMEYNVLNNWYKRILSEDNIKVIIYAVMMLCKVFRWKEQDYHELDCCDNN